VAYEKASSGEKAKQAEAVGLAGEEVAGLTGPVFLRTRGFRGKYDELAGGKITKVTAQGDTATVYWDDAEGDHEKTLFLREGGRWKAWLAVPQGKQP
jgi:hypothetical protein